MTGTRELIATAGDFTGSCDFYHASRVRRENEEAGNSRPLLASARLPFKSRNSIRRLPLLSLSLSLASGLYSSPSVMDSRQGVQAGR